MFPRRGSYLIGNAPINISSALFAAADALAGGAALLEGHAAGRNARDFLHLELTLEAAAPLGASEAAAAGGHFLDLVDGL